MSAPNPEDPRIGLALARIASGDYVSKACALVGYPRQSLYELVDGPDASPIVADMYARARLWQADAHADKIAQLADQVVSGEVGYNEGRVAIDAHKWSASKLRPKVYGDRTELSVTGAIATLVRLDVDPALAEGLRLLGERYSRGTLTALPEAAPALPGVAGAADADPPPGG